MNLAGVGVPVFDAVRLRSPFVEFAAFLAVALALTGSTVVHRGEDRVHHSPIAHRHGDAGVDSP